MKKLVAVFCFVLALIGCSGDDNSKPVDPISSQPYIPLATLDDLEPGIYNYIGNKIGDRPVGLVSELSDSCKRSDVLDVANNVDKTMFYYLHGGVIGEYGCPLKKNYPLRISTRIFSNGYIYLNNAFHTNQPMEIGFQGGYLRLEDYISDYSYTPKKEKVYLYFEKK